jgi:hypothetical protein
MVGILYIFYGGVLEQLGQSQVLAYLKRLTMGRNIHLISFEKKRIGRVLRREMVYHLIFIAQVSFGIPLFTTSDLLY